MYWPFNSRPHAEVDVLMAAFTRDLVNLSTHDLTQRSTRTEIFLPRPQELSTHDLTQRSTLQKSVGGHGSGTFNSRPHAEVDPIVHIM